MSRRFAREELVDYRESLWVSHAERVLSKFLLPKLNHLLERARGGSFDAARRPWVVLMENRINSQWLMTWLNCLLMMPAGTGICFCSDGRGIEEIQNWFSRQGWNLPNFYLLSLQPWLGEKRLDGQSALNSTMKSSDFWNHLPGERLLVIQTDALL